MTNTNQSSTTDMGVTIASGVGAMAESIVTPETFYTVECFDPDGNLKWIEQCKNRVVTTGLNKLLDATFKTGLAAPAWYVGLVSTGFTDGVSNGNTTFTSATATFAAGDAGRSIIIRAMGASGVDLVTTIAAVINTTALTLTAATTLSGTSVKFLFDARLADTAAAHTTWTESTAYTGNRATFTPGTILAGNVDNSASKASFTINADNTLIGGMFLTDNSTPSSVSGTLYGMAPFSTVGFRQVNNGDTLQVTTTLSMTAT